MKIEEEFFPVIAGELGTSKETAMYYQKKLKEFAPQIKVIRHMRDLSGRSKHTEVFSCSFHPHTIPSIHPPAFYCSHITPLPPSRTSSLHSTPYSAVSLITITSPFHFSYCSLTSSVITSPFIIHTHQIIKSPCRPLTG